MAQPRKLHDKYFLQAKAEGYLARSAYKLKEIQERGKIIWPGDRVLDLGCAPGSWMQVACELTGPKGRIVGIDLQEIREGFPAQVRTMVGDAFTAEPAVLLAAAAKDGEPPEKRKMFDVVLSDMAPNTSGHGDDLLSARLCRRVLELLPGVLKPGGHLAMKIFEGAEHPRVLHETKAMFRDARSFKPHACRDVSRETYIVAYGYSGATSRDSKPPKGVAPAKPAPKAGWGSAS
ncbi:MAG: RlmE family RNA methyltransferase [Planctomycetota bacterium]|nr:RlmE family RNA methyltransferase [Planctomycetota bacterium]